MTIISVKKAETISALRQATWIRCSVFADEFDYLKADDYPAGHEVDGFDLLPTTVNFVGFVDGNPAATVRLLFPNPDVAARCKTRLGLSIELELELKGIRPDMVLAEIPRSSVVKEYRRTGIMRHLYNAAYQESIRHGSTHWIATGNTETDNATDAWIVHRLLEARGFHLSAFDATYRGDPRSPISPRYQLYDPVQRDQVIAGDIEGIQLPRTLELFASMVGVRYFGSPFYDNQFRMFAMPLLLQLSDFENTPYGSPAI
jgi:GNAT superfamily N-acetyltransferase